MRREADGAPSPAIEVSVRDPAWRKTLADGEALSRRAASAALARLGAGSKGELSIVLAHDAFVHRLNRDYRGEDSATNVLAFPATSTDALSTAEPRAGSGETTRLLGDVVVAHETVVAEAGQLGKSVDDHLAHLVVHGVLHLLGYDHRTDAEAVNMERLEAAILATLAIEDPYRTVRGRNARAADEGHERPIQSTAP